MNWNIGGHRNPFLKLKPKLGLYETVVNSFNSPHKIVALTVLAMKQFLNTEKTNAILEIVSQTGQSFLVDKKN